LRFLFQIYIFLTLKWLKSVPFLNGNTRTNAKPMRITFFLLASFMMVASCSNERSALSLFDQPGNWEGEEQLIPVDGMVSLEGEYKTWVYQPGIFKTFENFLLTTEVYTMPGANASILFHTNKRDLSQGYEVIIDNSSVGNWDHLLKTGSLKSVRNIHYKMVENESWFSLSVKVEENHIYIAVNGHPVVDYIEPEMPFRTPENKYMTLGTGTFAIKTLFGNTGVRFRNMQVTALPAAEKQKNEDPEFVRRITELHTRYFPLVDYHVHEKGDLTLPLLMERSARLGINYGVAANCGLKFPIETDAHLEAYQASIAGLPIFKAMQAEGREWVDMFSPELVKEFDYAFTDAMTWTNANGTRMRLWIPEETEVGDPQDFMDQLVTQIEKVVTEPIAIYVNPTYLPAEIAQLYDELWTDERIERVVRALVENNVALEINSRLELPGDKVISRAKEAGVKFALGTNNTNAENLGRLEWALEKVDQHQLQPSDMFLPVTE